jgi:hypothetical protein
MSDEPNAVNGKPLFKPIPFDRKGWLATAPIKPSKIIDDVDEVMGLLLEKSEDENDKTSERFHALINGVDAASSAEGSIIADRVLAAQMIRDRADKAYPSIADANITAIKTAMSYALRRHNMTINQRLA